MGWKMAKLNERVDYYVDMASRTLNSTQLKFIQNGSRKAKRYTAVRITQYTIKRTQSDKNRYT